MKDFPSDRLVLFFRDGTNNNHVGLFCVLPSLRQVRRTAGSREFFPLRCMKRDRCCCIRKGWNDQETLFPGVTLQACNGLLASCELELSFFFCLSPCRVSRVFKWFAWKGGRESSRTVLCSQPAEQQQAFRLPVTTLASLGLPSVLLVPHGSVPARFA